MSTFGDYKSYKKYEPAYANWKNKRDIQESKRMAYLKQNPNEMSKEDIQRGQALVRAIDIMDEYSQKRAQDVEVATQSVVSMALEFMIFAGPVGCGISTVLRMIAGVEDITDGELLVDGERMNEVPSIDRNMAMIFKNGKLYPQMNIYDNLAFGLKLKELPKGEIDARIAEVTEVLKIGHLLDKMTEDLDEQERALVVLGRAMVKKPKVFLLDEPFSSLSKDVKRHMQKLVRKLYDQMHITVIYVTHNREDIQNTDARIAVMNDGSIQQIGTIGELYDNPATPYVSEFLGVAAQAVC